MRIGEDGVDSQPQVWGGVGQVLQLHAQDFLPEGGALLLLLEPVANLAECIDLLASDLKILQLELQFEVLLLHLVVVQQFAFVHKLELLDFLQHLGDLPLFFLAFLRVPAE